MNKPDILLSLLLLGEWRLTLEERTLETCGKSLSIMNLGILKRETPKLEEEYLETKGREIVPS